MKDVDELTLYLKRVNAGEDPVKLRKQADRFFEKIKPSDLAMAEQNLLDSGCSISDLISHQKEYIGLIGDQLHKLWASLPHGHIVRQILAEHELYFCMLADLAEVNNLIQSAEQISDKSSEFRKLSHLVQHLAAAQEHCEREEDIIFPELRKRRLGNLVRAMKSDHSYIKFAICNLIKLLDDHQMLDLLEFKTRLQSITTYLISAGKEHMFFENNILYPLAIELISDRKMWDRMKAICDEIGYCCLHDEPL
jgi:uncharacterized protein